MADKQTRFAFHKAIEFVGIELRRLRGLKDKEFTSNSYQVDSLIYDLNSIVQDLWKCVAILAQSDPDLAKEIPGWIERELNIGVLAGFTFAKRSIGTYGHPNL
ncbi:MAG: hypothetical protein JNJ77_05025 [Planctomycetia bacterium]|nr:hypothetical protein [Planctomycetia bacterium]